MIKSVKIQALLCATAIIANVGTLIIPPEAAASRRSSAYYETEKKSHYKRSARSQQYSQEHNAGLLALSNDFAERCAALRIEMEEQDDAINEVGIAVINAAEGIVENEVNQTENNRIGKLISKMVKKGARRLKALFKRE